MNFFKNLIDWDESESFFTTIVKTKSLNWECW